MHTHQRALSKHELILANRILMTWTHGKHRHRKTQRLTQHNGTHLKCDAPRAPRLWKTTHDAHTDKHNAMPPTTEDHTHQQSKMLAHGSKLIESTSSNWKMTNMRHMQQQWQIIWTWTKTESLEPDEWSMVWTLTTTENLEHGQWSMVWTWTIQTTWTWSMREH